MAARQMCCCWEELCRHSWQATWTLLAAVPHRAGSIGCRIVDRRLISGDAVLHFAPTALSHPAQSEAFRGCCAGVDGKARTPVVPGDGGKKNRWRSWDRRIYRIIRSDFSACSWSHICCTKQSRHCNNRSVQTEFRLLVRCERSTSSAGAPRA